MENLYAYLFGLLISFVGVITPGMLNMTAAKISLSKGKQMALWFSFAAVIIVFLQSFLGVYFAKYLDANPYVTNTIKKFATVIFVLLTVFFIRNGLREKKEVNIKLKDNFNPFWYGISLSSLNMFAIPYYAVSSLTLASKDLFSFKILEIILFSLGVFSGVFLVYYIYSVFFKKIEHRISFISNNINFLIAAATGFVALSAIYKIMVE
mgnify:CR=1 FL=1